ncbi:MAG: hypothetical protein GY744_09490 [Gammaproteobacteria bacterium]|nr:hypothetical protein [Gammaproteobacteria bacterium]
MDFNSLKDRHREIRDTLPENISLRVHRALSWLDCAEQNDNDDAKFIFLWISFNSAYAHEIEDRRHFKERKVLVNFLKLLLEVDSDKTLYGIAWDEFPKSIRLLLSNKYVFQFYWDYQNQKITEDEWEYLFESAKISAQNALGSMDTVKILAIVFDRLYTLRNQLIHGGATWNGSVNREQIRDGVNILSRLVPAIIFIMMNNKPRIIGQPCYPVKT